MKVDFNLPQIADSVEKIKLEDFLHSYALPYAYYTIHSRALIGDDGLKPVARRILYSMYEGDAKTRSVKAVKVAADVMGDYHPHGDSSIQEALANLGQDFRMRVPLIEPQGDVGFNTGDKPAQARYWEAKLSKAGLELVKNVDYNAVKMVRNCYDTKEEPSKLPINFPVGIINGTFGIAVGYSSFIPPHNPTEVMNACIERIKGNLKNSEDVFKYIKGPDFPTGGELIGIDGINDYFTNGKGTFTLRGRYKISPHPYSKGKHIIHFYELPYQISAEQVRTSIYDLQNPDKKDSTKKRKKQPRLLEIEEVKDLSGRTTGLSLEITIKQGANPKQVLEDLWKYTPCQQKVSVQLNVLYQNKPKILSMFQLIDQFIDFKKECFRNVTEYKKSLLEKDLKRFEAILSVMVDIDKALKIIKESETSEIANKSLQNTFKIDKEQAEYILQMQLRSLVKADRNSFLIKKNKTESEVAFYQEVLTNEKSFNKEVIKELETTKKIIDSDRLTVITNQTYEDLVQYTKEQESLVKKFDKGINCIISILDDGSVVKGLEPHERSVKTISSHSLDSLFGVMKDGTIKEIPIPIIGVTPISSEVLLKNSISFVSNDVLSVTNKGNLNITKGKLKEGVLIKLEDDEEIIFSSDVGDSSSVCLMDKDGNIARFDINKIRSVFQGSGTIVGMKSECVLACLCSPVDIIISATNKTIKATDEEEVLMKGRGIKGSLLHKLGKGEELVFLGTINDTKKMLIGGNEVKIPTVTSKARKGESYVNQKISIIKK